MDEFSIMSLNEISKQRNKSNSIFVNLDPIEATGIFIFIQMQEL